GGSNWGFKGREDLGGGLAALFQLQGNLTLPSGVTGGPNSSSGTSFFNQIAMVGLHGDCGDVKFGRQVSPMYWAMASTDSRQGRYFGSSLTALVGINSASGAFIGNNSNASFGSVYNDNAVIYTLPTWHDVTVNLEYALGNTAGSFKANSQQALTAQYARNGLKLSALYYNGYGNNQAAATTLYTGALGSATAAAAAVAAAGITPSANTNRLTSLGALYNWDAYTVHASYFMARNPAHAVVKGGSASLDMWSVGAAWRVTGTMDLSLGYYRMTDNTNRGNSASQLALGLDYLLSKRTTLYVEAADISNRGANMNLSPIYSTPVMANTGVRAWMAGIRHTF
ncbi:MAG: porin, partial [Curvibacter sp.]|nr:porin [Curvibacter sp.]